MTLEQLIKLLHWLSSPGGKCPLVNDNIVSEDLHKLHAECKAMLGDLSVTGENDRSSQQKSTDLISVENTDRFLQFCLTELNTQSDEGSINLHKAILLWLVRTHDALKGKKAEQMICGQKIAAVFSCFLERQEEAVIFYEENKPLQQIYPIGAQLISVHKNKLQAEAEEFTLSMLVENITEQLGEIKTPLSIVSLFKTYFDRPLYLAAYIIWMLTKGVDERDIIGSGLLHDFFMFHVHMLGEENNPIPILYRQLRASERGQKIVELAMQTSAGSEAFKHYNLQGNQSSATDLIQVELNEPVFIKIGSSSLFDQLYERFGTEFLYQAFIANYNEKKNNIILTSALNLKGAVFAAVPQLINKLLDAFRGEGLSLRLKALSKLISYESFEVHLLAKKNMLVFFLIVDREDMRTLFTYEDFVSYIQTLLVDDVIHNKKKFKLLKRLQSWYHENDDHEKSHYLYQQMVNLSLTHEEIGCKDSTIHLLRERYEELMEQGDNSDVSSEMESEDESITYESIMANDKEESSDAEESFPEVELQFSTLEFLEKQQHQYESRWQQRCQRILGKDVFAQRDYEELREDWQLIVSKMNFFLSIRSANSTLSSEYTQLKETLIKKRFHLLQETFDLETMLPALFDLNDEQALFECQQTLVNLLLESISEKLAIQIIMVLSRYNRHWWLISWHKDKKSLLEEAVSRKNEFLMTYLLAQARIYFDKLTFLKAFRAIIWEEDLALINLFLIPEMISQLDEADIRSLFMAALSIESTQVLALLLEKKQLWELSEELQSTLIFQAVELGFDEGLSLVCRAGSEPLEYDLAKALGLAVVWGHWRCVEVICALSDNFPTQTRLTSIFRRILREMEPREQLRFIEICKSRFTSDLIWEGVQYCRHNGNKETLDFLISLREDNGERKLTKQDVAAAILSEVAPNGDSAMLSAIYNDFPDDLLPDSAVEQKAFEIACQNHDTQMIRILIDNDPEQLWTMTLTEAAPRIKDQIMFSLRLIDAKILDNQLIQAVSKGKLQCVKAIMLVIAQTHRRVSLHSLSELAAKEGHPHLVAWFDEIHALDSYRRLNPVRGDKTPLAKAYEILEDYTKCDSRLLRFFTGHWNRHHIADVNKIMRAPPKNLETLLLELQKIKLVNSQGSLARRITYIRDFLLPLADDNDLSSERSEESLLNLGS
ncbi:Dot/Icm secretion system substrate [Legionella lansingensis]|uniref:RavJ-like C-terminal domain-containing protein n=1 Tax=Legionella lansingensis TaxID=45067 RepID=A0A0W0VUD5_9GAMM|nr:DUF5617 domain-containing protein [Legionella lansingensis]KTD23589.1 hypothetical protein Llan_0724 [Legionella lansingensis]SNV52356.1 Dot/Icm secretion system substrate [Legionella lansingensis]